MGGWSENPADSSFCPAEMVMILYGNIGWPARGDLGGQMANCPCKELVLSVISQKIPKCFRMKHKMVTW